MYSLISVTLCDAFLGALSDALARLRVMVTRVAFTLFNRPLLSFSHRLPSIMKLYGLFVAAAVLAGPALAAPNNDVELQAVFDDFNFNDVAHGLADAVTAATEASRKNVFDKAKKIASEASQKVRTAFKDGALRDFVEHQGIACE